MIIYTHHGSKEFGGIDRTLLNIILITCTIIFRTGYDRKQIVTSVSILSCFMPFLGYRDNDSGLRPSSYPYMLGRA